MWFVLSEMLARKIIILHKKCGDMTVWSAKNIVVCKALADEQAR